MISQKIYYIETVISIIILVVLFIIYILYGEKDTTSLRFIFIYIICEVILTFLSILKVLDVISHINIRFHFIYSILYIVSIIYTIVSVIIWTLSEIDEENMIIYYSVEGYLILNTIYIILKFIIVVIVSLIESDDDEKFGEKFNKYFFNIYENNMKKIGNIKLFSEIKDFDINLDDPICSICFEEYDNNTKVKLLQCNHFFHIHCIDEWLNKKSTCPLCRNNIKYPTF